MSVKLPMGSLTKVKFVLPFWLSRAVMLLAAIVVVCAGYAAPAQAQTANHYTNNTASTTDGINDIATPCSNPFKRTFVVGTSYTVADVNIGALVTHTRRGDLTVTLVSPANTRVTLINRIGGTVTNINTLFDDQAATSVSNYTFNDTITAVPPYNRSYIPAAALAAFNGEAAAGTWTLEICDSATKQTGTFNQADLYLTPQPSVFADLSLTQTVSSATPSDLDTISYTLTVTNSASSPSTATGVVARDLLPSGVVFVSDTGSGSYNASTGDWAIGTLAPGQSRTITITVTVAAGDKVTVSNVAEITASSVFDIDSTPNNAVTTEDDYSSRSFTVAVVRSAGIMPTLTCSAGSVLFDWDAQAWTAGSTVNAYSLVGPGTVGFTITNPDGVFLNNATYGGQSPAKQTAMTGGLATAQNSLELLVDVNSQSSAVTTTIKLGSAVPGLQFTIFDVDFFTGQFADRVTVTGSLNGVTVLPTLTNGSANFVSGTTAYGDATSDDFQANGNVPVTFTSAVDTVSIVYGDHSYAPTNPGQQGIALHDITICNPVASLSVTKVSLVISDPTNGATNPKAIPGAVIEYCILVSNSGTATLSNIAANDVLPAKYTYTPGSMVSGTSCAAAATAEDDNNTGADETDPYGAAISGTTITATASSLLSATSFALKFRGTVN